MAHELMGDPLMAAHRATSRPRERSALGRTARATELDLGRGVGRDDGRRVDVVCIFIKVVARDGWVGGDDDDDDGGRCGGGTATEARTYVRARFRGAGTEG